MTGLTLVLLSVAMLMAKDVCAGDRWFPSRHLLPSLITGPRDPATQAQIVHTDPSPTAYGTGPAGEVSLSVAAAILRVTGDGPTDGIVIGLEAAVFSRFSFQVVTRELVHTDWLFTLPAVWHMPSGWLRLRYLHTSSHLGDEYQRRFGPSSINFSRDGADVTILRRLQPGIEAYGIGFVSLNSHPEQRVLLEARLGLQTTTDQSDPGQRFACLDLHVEESTDWSPRWSGRVGMYLAGVQGRPLSLEVRGMSGPSPMGQFRQQTHRQLSLGLSWVP